MDLRLALVTALRVALVTALRQVRDIIVEHPILVGMTGPHEGVGEIVSRRAWWLRPTFQKL